MKTQPLVPLIHGVQLHRQQAVILSTERVAQHQHTVNQLALHPHVRLIMQDPLVLRTAPRVRVQLAHHQGIHLPVRTHHLALHHLAGRIQLQLQEAIALQVAVWEVQEEVVVALRLVVEVEAQDK